MFLLEACTTQIKNDPFYVDAGKLGAIRFYLLSDGSTDIPLDVWTKERFGMICESPQTFAHQKSAIEVLCQNSGACTFEQQKQIDAISKKIDSAQKKIKK